MNFVRGFWSTKPSANGDIQSQASTTVHGAQPTSFNSVTFTTTTATSGNSIIITTVPATPQNTQQIGYSNNQSIHELKPSQMASPTDSFHSAASNFEQQTNGKVNLAYIGSTAEINNNNSNHHNSNNLSRAVRPHQQRQVVVREQYWSWNWPWQRWNTREKIFLIVIIVLSLCVLILTSILSVVLQKNFHYRDMILSKLGNDAENNTS